MWQCIHKQREDMQKGYGFLEIEPRYEKADRRRSPKPEASNLNKLVIYEEYLQIWILSIYKGWFKYCVESSMHVNLNRMQKPHTVLYCVCNQDKYYMERIWPFSQTVGFTRCIISNHVHVWVYVCLCVCLYIQSVNRLNVVYCS